MAVFAAMLNKLLMFCFCAATIAFGQESGKITFFKSGEDCVKAPAEKVNIYQPVFVDHLAAWQKLVASGKATLVQDGKTYCVEEWSVEGKVAGKHIIRWPANNPYFKGEDGKIADGRCGNRVYQIWEVPPLPTPAPPPPEAVVTPPPPEAPAPPPPPTPVIKTYYCFTGGDEQSGFTGSAAGGEGRWMFEGKEVGGEKFKPPANLGPGNYTATFEVVANGEVVKTCPRTWQISIPVEVTFEIPDFPRGHKFPIPCFPRERGWYGIGLPIAECAVIAAGAWWLWPSAPKVVKPTMVGHTP